MNERLDYYKILELEENAAVADIKTSYKRLMLKYHPDVNKAEEAQEKARQINEAYSVLSDETKRRHYDMSRKAPAFGFPGMSDMFSEFMRGWGNQQNSNIPRKGNHYVFNLR